ncbi:MAG: STAS domain-containing protein [Deltaproteobacteria bacterium]|nr:STAS domain-containing protein [Deltaproteobacteria bacterium]
MGDEPNVLTPTSLVIADVASFWTQVRAGISRGSLVVDLSRVERIDGAGAQMLQLLVSQGGASPITLQHPSPATVTLARGLGLEAVAALT